jgi:hypothetical protein
MLRMPEWAEAGLAVEGRLPIYHVQADEFYPALLLELADAQEARGFDVDEEGERMLGEIDPEDPDAYALEVAYQTMKMDMQVGCGFGIEIRVTDPEKKWAQKDRPDSDRVVEKGGREFRGADIATMPGGPQEAREHYRRLRGFIPS